MGETQQEQTRAHHNTWLFRSLLATVLMVPAATLAQGREDQPVVFTAQELAVSGRSRDGTGVQVEGKVIKVDRVAEVIDGVSTYFFIVSDGTGDIRIASPAAAMFVVEDLVRVEGVYHVSRSGSDSNYIDASEGTIEVLEASKSKLGQLLRRPPEESLSVPVSPVATRWSRSVDIASVLSAFFALLASTTLLLRMRRFNIGLTLTMLSCGCGSDSGRLCASVRAISTRSHSPQVSATAELAIPNRGRIRGAVREANRRTDSRAQLPPIPVFDKETLWLEFPVPKETAAKDFVKGKVILRDVLCRKKFSLRLSDVKEGPETEAFEWAANAQGEGTSGQRSRLGEGAGIRLQSREDPRVPQKLIVWITILALFSILSRASD